MQPFLHQHRLMLSYYGAIALLEALYLLFALFLCLLYINSYNDIIRSHIATKQGFGKRNNGL